MRSSAASSAGAKMERLSIDVLSEEHKQIKAYAALAGETIREFVIESLRQRLQRAKEQGQLSDMSGKPSLILKQLWDNKKDSVYDAL